MPTTRTRTPRTPTARTRAAAWPAAAALIPLLLTAACSGDSADSGKDAPDPGPDGTRSASSVPGGRGPLTRAQLADALVTARDVPGWVVQASRTADTLDDATLTADRPGCQPLADVASSDPKIRRVAFVGAAVARATKATAQPGAINQMLVASHAPGDAEKVIAAVRDALGTCTSFTAVDHRGTKTPFAISKGPAVPTGDEAVSYVMADASDTAYGAALVALVRTGATVTTYLSVKSSGGAGDLPVEVARKEHEKLTAAQR